jgi:hypothetical protein
MTTNTQPFPHTALARPKKTADHFQISLMTLHRWRQQAGFPKPRKRGAVILYDIPAITLWLEEDS